ncbi:MAG: ABC transporter ATP-binding protein [Firmicutes bacterium]|nr:ABC transporter ATP-binding protein [Bacillota bacterium]
MDIIVSNLSKSFGSKRVLDRFNATFPARSVTCLMGPSGCGKTTLLNILMGLMQADSGEIAGMPQLKSAVFQEDRLCESFNAVANVRLVCDKGVNNEEIIRHLERVGLAGSWQQAVSELSGGMRRRVAIVRAMLAPSEILFLDEPFKGLDQDTKQMTMQYVKDNIKEKTVIMVTHSLEEAEAFADQLIVMGF